MHFVYAPEAMQNISFTQLYSEEVVFVVRHCTLRGMDRRCFRTA